MKKILSLMLVLLMCLSAFAACDNSDASSTSSSESESSSELDTEALREQIRAELQGEIYSSVSGEIYSSVSKELESAYSSALDEAESEIYSSVLEELLEQMDADEYGNFGYPEYLLNAHRLSDENEIPIYDDYNVNRCYDALLFKSNTVNDHTYFTAPSERIFTSYDDLIAVLGEENSDGIDEELFDENYVIFVDVNIVDGLSRTGGYHGLYYDGEKLTICMDYIYYNPMTNGTFDRYWAFLAVPKSHFGNCKVSEYEGDIAVNVLYYRSSRLINEDFPTSN